ncbi:ROK family protein [Paenibacillus sp. 1011MAR3C5]|uniref:ROK family protein n=1 Tax=Paenibacillus sp. 1011MAR3C5 TaxID=1675787 RepID=UPI0015FFD603|nr:ROK family protein [Paenibacillus sp. 1011MAR3C5]
MRSAVGIDLGGTNIKWGIVAEDGEVLLEGLVPTESERGPDELLNKLSAIAEQAVQSSTDLNIALDSVGIGTAGQVQRASGIVMGATATLPGWAGMPLGERIGRETGLPVVVDNDVNMIAIGEAWIGAGQEWEDFLCVALGTGVGGCWVSDRRVYGGREGYAGEFGHMIVSMGGRECSCGNRGCWESYASVTGLKKLAYEEWTGGPWEEPETLFQYAREGNIRALSIVTQYCEYVAAGLTGLIHIYNPSAIVLGGAIVAGQGTFLLERIQTLLNRQVMPVYQQPEPVAVVAAQLGRHAGVVGAALAALKR